MARRSILGWAALVALFAFAGGIFTAFLLSRGRLRPEGGSSWFQPGVLRGTVQEPSPTPTPTITAAPTISSTPIPVVDAEPSSIPSADGGYMDEVEEIEVEEDGDRGELVEKSFDQFFERVSWTGGESLSSHVEVPRGKVEMSGVDLGKHDKMAYWLDAFASGRMEVDRGGFSSRDVEGKSSLGSIRPRHSLSLRDPLREAGAPVWRRKEAEEMYRAAVDIFEGLSGGRKSLSVETANRVRGLGSFVLDSGRLWRPLDALQSLMDDGKAAESKETGSLAAREFLLRRVIGRAGHCQEYFGNGFTRDAPILQSKSKLTMRVPNSAATVGEPEASRAWCWLNRGLGEQGKPMCELRNVVLVPSRVQVARGGEEISKVIQRPEDQELPVYSNGAFQVLIPPGERLDKEELDRRRTQHGLPSIQQAESSILNLHDAAVKEAGRTHRKVPDTPLMIRGKDDMLDSLLWQADANVLGRPGLSHDAFLLGAEKLGDLVDADVKKILEATDVREIDQGGEFAECSVVVDAVGLLVTRYEYANLWHTSTDWYNVFVAVRALELGNEKLQVIFLDGHAQSPQMDETWTALFGAPKHIKEFEDNTCFRRLVVVPLGYGSPLSLGLNPLHRCPLSPFVSDFRRTTLRAFGISVSQATTETPFSGFSPMWTQPQDSTDYSPRTPWSSQEAFASDQCSQPNSMLKVLFIHREDYLPHPRSKGIVDHRLNNAPEIVQELRAVADDVNALTMVARTLQKQLDSGTIDAETAQNKLLAIKPKARQGGRQGVPPPWSAHPTYPLPTIRQLAMRPMVEIAEGFFSKATMREQLLAIRSSCIIVAAHGAALSHSLFARPGTKVQEIQPTGYYRPHFIGYANWAGIDLSVLRTYDKNRGDPGLVGLAARAMMEETWWSPSLRS